MRKNFYPNYTQKNYNNSTSNFNHSPNFNINPTHNNNFYNALQCPNVLNKKNTEEKKAESSDENPLFEIFGIQLFNDDILILLLIFCLYKEDIDDKLLLLALFSLLFV